MAMPLTPVIIVKENAPDTCYLTAGGYLVTLNKYLMAPSNLCPGETLQGNKVTSGWGWRADGSIIDLQLTWAEKLQIVKLMDFPIPKPPAGYKYLDGYPQWRAPKAGEWFAESDTYVEKAYKDLSTSYLIISPITKEECVDITDSHPDLTPREEIDYFDGPIHQFQITQKGSIRKTIKEWRESYCKFRHYCLPEHVPPKEKVMNTEVIKTGDLVECVDSSADIGLITKGSKYTVIDHSGGSMIKIKDDRNKDFWFVASKFKKVDKPTLLLEHGKTYLTADGYIVPIIKESGGFFTTAECSPGVTSEGKTIQQLNSEASIRNNKGWLYSEFGETCLNEEWNKKLKIVKELPFSLPTAPEGYRYKDGFPKLKTVEPGDIYLVSHIADKNGLPPKCYGTATNSQKASTSTGGFDSLRLILEVAYPALPDGFEWTQDPPEFRKPKKGEFYTNGEKAVMAFFDEMYYKLNKWIVKQKAASPLKEVAVEEFPRYYIPENTELFAYIEVTNKDKYRCIRINGEVGSEVSLNLKHFENRKKITKEEAEARISKVFIPTQHKITNLCTEITTPQSRFSYWVTEPIGNMYGAAKSSVRYIIISSVLAAIGYTAYNPARAIGFVKSCLPKVNIEWRTPK